MSEHLQIFFFSSRRRHTRLQGDWSSDVCSSDLIPAHAGAYFELSLRHFQRALELDPKYAPAWAGIAHCHAVRAGRGMAPAAEANEQARAAAMKALELDDSVAQAYASLANVAAQELDLRGAIRYSERA